MHPPIRPALVKIPSRSILFMECGLVYKMFSRRRIRPAALGADEISTMNSACVHSSKFSVLIGIIRAPCAIRCVSSTRKFNMLMNWTLIFLWTIPEPIRRPPPLLRLLSSCNSCSSSENFLLWSPAPFFFPFLYDRLIYFTIYLSASIRFSPASIHLEPDSMPEYFKLSPHKDTHPPVP